MCFLFLGYSWAEGRGERHRAELTVDGKGQRVSPDPVRSHANNDKTKKKKVRLDRQAARATDRRRARARVPTGSSHFCRGGARPLPYIEMKMVNWIEDKGAPGTVRGLEGFRIPDSFADERSRPPIMHVLCTMDVGNGVGRWPGSSYFVIAVIYLDRRHAVSESPSSFRATSFGIS